MEESTGATSLLPPCLGSNLVLPLLRARFASSQFCVRITRIDSCHVRCRDKIANSHFSLSQIVPGGPRAVWRSHPPGGKASTSWGQVTRLLRMFCIHSTSHSHGIFFNMHAFLLQGCDAHAHSVRYGTWLPARPKPPHDSSKQLQVKSLPQNWYHLSDS